MFNPSKRISKFGGQNFSLEVPCGQCAECKEMMRTSWYFRTYYHCKEIYNKNGYVYFDTLTYSTDNLPHVQDICDKVSNENNFPCFNVAHYRRFILDLRQYLKRHGYEDVRMDYFMTSEYGLNPKDGKTFRPHYHILFFIDCSNSDKKLSPYELSELVAKFWKYGRTDGLPYKDHSYVKKHIYGKCYTRDFVHMRAVCNYVSKYVTKDSDFQGEIERRLLSIFEELDDPRMSYHMKKKYKDKYKEIKRSIDQFHRQSHHFGEYFLADPEVDFKEVLKTGMMSMPDKNSIVKHAPLDSYYIRKMFYEKKTDETGNQYWTLTDLGKRWKLERLLQSIDRMANKYDETFMNIPYWYGSEKADELMNKAVKYLDGRNFKDFAVYLLLYKGKTRFNLRENNLVLPDKNSLSPFEEDLSVWMNFVMSDVHEMKEEDCLFNYSSQSDKYRFDGNMFISDKNLGNKDAGYVSELRSVYDTYGYDDWCDCYRGTFIQAVNKARAQGYYGNLISQKDFVIRYCINENSDYRFRNFDKLYSLFKTIQMDRSEHKQRLFDHLESVKKFWKTMSSKTI